MSNVGSPSSSRASASRVLVALSASLVLEVGADRCLIAQGYVTEGASGLAGAAGVVIGDFDGDGRTDLVTITTAGGLQRFETYLGDGFAFANGIASPYGGKETDGLALGDIDGDGDLDVVANSIDPESGASLPFLVVGRGNANGTFAVNMTGTIWAFRESAFADLDLDGDLDLVALTSNSIFHLRNHGTGTLNGGNTVNDPTLMGGSSISPQRLVVADFDVDGDPDVAGMGAFGPIVLVRNSLAAGASTLVAWQTITGATSALDFAAVDLHGDGDFDLATTGTNPTNELRVVEALGGGTFGPSTSIVGAMGSTFLLGADVDLDGRGDLVTERQVHRSLTAGLPIVHATHVLPPTERSHVADFNGDQRPDLLLVGSAASSFPLAIGELVLNDGTGRFPSRLGSPSPTIRGGFAIDHYDGDGHLDLLALAWNPGPSGFAARILSGLGDGTFTDGAVAIADVQAQVSLNAPPSIAADLNNDGLSDLLVADANASVATPRLQSFLVNGNGGFSASVSTFLPVATTMLHLGFVDADLHVDAVLERIVGTTCEYRVAFGDGLGGFTLSPHVRVSPGPAPFAIPEPTAIVDVTGDGLGDLIVRTAALGPIRVWRGLGDGSFVFQGDTPWANDGVFTVAELTGDSAADLVLLELVDSKLRLEVRRGSGNGTFTAGASVESPGIVDLLGVEVVDFDGDGDRDVVGYGATSGHFAAFPILGAGAFGDAIFHRVGVFAAGYPIRKGPLFADADGDGRFDAIALAGSTQLHDEIVVLPGACAGRSVGFGHGCAGSGGFTPRIALVGIPCVGNVVGFELRDGLGGSFALVFLGAGETVTPITGGCDLLIAPLLPYAFAIPLSGIGAGQGKVAVTTFLPPSIDGAELTLQAFVADPTLAGGASASAGLAARFQD